MSDKCPCSKPATMRRLEPAPAAMSDAELRKEVSRLAKSAVSLPQSLPALRADSRVSLCARLGDQWVFLGDDKTALRALHAALTVLARPYRGC